MTNKPRRFVIFSAARSGTSLLSSTLNTHPNIFTHGEIYHPRPKWHLRGTFADWSDEQTIAARADKIGYLKMVFDQAGADVVGFKMWHSQEPQICDSLLAIPAVSNIIYERENRLAQYASGALAKQSGIWNRSAQNAPYKGRDSEPVEFNARRFLSYVRRQEKTFAHYRKYAKGPVLDMTYADLTTRGFHPVLRFLGVPEVNLEPQKQKLHSSNIIARFQPSAHKEVHAVLKDLGHPEWVEE